MSMLLVKPIYVYQFESKEASRLYITDFNHKLIKNLKQNETIYPQLIIETMLTTKFFFYVITSNRNRICRISYPVYYRTNKVI